MSIGSEFDFETFLRLSPKVLEQKKPILLRGRHGIGKSQLCYLLAEDVLKLPVVEIRLSQMDTGDLLGLPFEDGEQTAFRPMNWLKKVCDEPCVLFIDEIDRATRELRQGVFQLADSRSLNGNMLHEDSVIIAACNSGHYGELYDVVEMEPAELSRWSVWDLKPTTNDWLDWAWQRINLNVRDFISKNPEHLEHIGKHEPGKVYPCRRSWTRLSDVLNNFEINSETVDDLFAISHSFIGLESSIMFCAFLQDRDSHVSVDELLDGTAFSAIEKYSMALHGALIEKLDQSDYLSYSLREDKCANLVKYSSYLNSELVVKFYHLIIKAHENNIKNIFGYIPRTPEVTFGLRVAEAIMGDA